MCPSNQEPCKCTCLNCLDLRKTSLTTKMSYTVLSLLVTIAHVNLNKFIPVKQSGTKMFFKPTYNRFRPGGDYQYIQTVWRLTDSKFEAFPLDSILTTRDLGTKETGLQSQKSTYRHMKGHELHVTVQHRPLSISLFSIVFRDQT